MICKKVSIEFGIVVVNDFDQRTCNMNIIRFGSGAGDGRNINNNKLSYRKHSSELDTSIGWRMRIDF